MLSPSGKVEWLCCECRSKDIQKVIAIGFGGLAMYVCNGCDRLNPWRFRLKISMKKDSQK